MRKVIREGLFVYCKSVYLNYIRIIMSNIWDKIYSDDSAFFGVDPSDFAKKCYTYFKIYGVKRILELRCGQGRDTIYV
jgi:hypothetical protein